MADSVDIAAAWHLLEITGIVQSVLCGLFGASDETFLPHNPSHTTSKVYTSLYLSWLYGPTMDVKTHLHAG